jgi:hypothetical protein
VKQTTPPKSNKQVIIWLLFNVAIIVAFVVFLHTESEKRITEKRTDTLVSGKDTVVRTTINKIKDK